jgi:hypothetical protein
MLQPVAACCCIARVRPPSDSCTALSSQRLHLLFLALATSARGSSTGQKQYRSEASTAGGCTNVIPARLAHMKPTCFAVVACCWRSPGRPELSTRPPHACLLACCCHHRSHGAFSSCVWSLKTSRCDASLVKNTCSMLQPRHLVCLSSHDDDPPSHCISSSDHAQHHPAVSAMPRGLCKPTDNSPCSCQRVASCKWPTVQTAHSFQQGGAHQGPTRRTAAANPRQLMSDTAPWLAAWLGGRCHDQPTVGTRLETAPVTFGNAWTNVVDKPCTCHK